MTKKEFKRAMQCGLGRCIQELKTCGNIEKYRDIILWGCTHNLAYDAQCEGTRSYYLYKLVKCYPDTDFFVDAVIPYFYKSIARSDWSFDQFCDFLGWFAGEGNPTALHALQENYRRMYDVLKVRKRRLSDGILPVRDNFEKLCIDIVNMPDYKEDCEAAYFRMVEELGCLILDNPLFETWGFDWFQACWENEFGKAKIRKQLEKRAENAKGTKVYFASMLKKEDNRDRYAVKRREKIENMTAREIYRLLQNGGKIGWVRSDIPIMLAPIMRRNGKEKEVKKLAAYYQRETDLVLKSQLLRFLANRYCTDLLDMAAVIADSKSENAALQENAFRALGFMTDIRVHNYALELLQKNEHLEDVISMLANNYVKEDCDILVALIKALPVTYQEKDICWHGPFMAVLDLLETRGVKHPPRELLYYMYEHTLCSSCRESILREMSRRKMLTREILQECLYDSNDEIRELAKKRLAKMEGNRNGENLV
ncbi:MAG: hypothetical protein K2K56_02720 [Lachnospiraceae bacterium]|nr:hypothetical protein [Lachnospiraceae bacterium]